MVDFNVDGYIDFSAGKFMKTLGKNLLPGALIMLAVGGKLIESKILSVNGTPDGRLFLEMIPGKEGGGIPIKLTEPISPNSVYAIKNPYGKDMKRLAAPTFYSEESQELYSEISGLLSEAYECYSEMGMSDPDIVSLFSLSLADAGINIEDGKEIISTFFSKTRSKLDPDYRLKYNLSRYGEATDKYIMPSEIGLKKYILGKVHPKAIFDPEDYGRGRKNKAIFKNLEMLTAVTRDHIDADNLRTIGDLDQLKKVIDKLPEDEKKKFYKAMKA